MASRAMLSNLLSIPDQHIQQRWDLLIHTGNGFRQVLNPGKDTEVLLAYTAQTWGCFNLTVLLKYDVSPLKQLLVHALVWVLSQAPCRIMTSHFTGQLEF